MVIDIKVEKGIPNKERIIKKKEGNQVPGTNPGNLVLFTEEKPHDVFTRKGADLFMKKKITLLDAIAGFCFKFQFLDGKEYGAVCKKG